MKIEIIDGNLYQWDTGRQVRLIPDPDESVVEVHFCCPCDPVAQVVLPGEDNTADIPNELLQAAGWLQVYVVTTTDTPGKRTLYHTKDRIRARKKPADYVYTETERRTWEGLDKRIGELEENQIDPDSVVARQQLAADAGKALVIGEDGVVKVGEVGGGSLVVEIIQNDFGFTTSHTSQEIYAAHTAGKTVQAHVFGRYAPCVNAYEHAAYFEQEDIETGAVRKLRATISDNEADVQYIDYTPPVTSVNGQTGDVKVSGSLIVTITENDDGTLTPSHTSQEIYAAYMGGKNVTLVQEDDSLVYNLKETDDEYAAFALTGDSKEGIERYVFEIEGNEAYFTSWSHPHRADPMTPATADEDGASGLVPAPAAGQQNMVLHGDGTWREVEGGETWELLADVTIEEAVNNFDYAFDSPQKKLKVIVNSVAADADTNYSGFTVWCNNEAGSTYYPSTMFYPIAIPRKTAKTSVYDISTYYIGDIPCIDVSTMIAEDKRHGDSAPRRYFVEGLTEPYFGKMMVPEIVRFSQNTYGTFAAGTRYRIYGVKA